eukprot:scaffold58672_cov39-Cyclotella_meneghiniana.AAC.2
MCRRTDAVLEPSIVPPSLVQPPLEATHKCENKRTMARAGYSPPAGRAGALEKAHTQTKPHNNQSRCGRGYAGVENC